MLGIIGGSGLYNLPDLDVIEHRTVKTPFGPPSDDLLIGSINGQPLVFLPRHGKGHTLTPSELPYQANIYALKAVGVTHLLTVSAVGSLKEELSPLTVVMPDQIIDRTVARPRTFFSDGIVAHVGIADPYCNQFSQFVADGAVAAGIEPTNGGTYVCIEGPQFSTKAESNLFRSWGCSVIGMTAMPEARLAREAELCYATMAMVTDYDVWHETEEAVHVDLVVQYLRQNTKAAQDIILQLVENGLPSRTCSCGEALAGAIVTPPDAITSEARERVGLIADRYLPPVS